MRFFRIASADFRTPGAAFSGVGASKTNHRWTWASPSLRAVYCSDSLSLACLERLVHIRPLPRIPPRSVFFAIDIPDLFLERPETKALPKGWNLPLPPAGARDFGTRFIADNENVGLVLPTAIVPIGNNVLINVLHPKFDLSWVSPAKPFVFDGRL